MRVWEGVKGEIFFINGPKGCSCCYYCGKYEQIDIGYVYDRIGFLVGFIDICSDCEGESVQININKVAVYHKDGKFKMLV